MNEQLKQIAEHPIWDGNLISKTMRDDLVKCGYVDCISGWNFLTKEGVKVCVNLKILKS